ITGRSAEDWLAAGRDDPRRSTPPAPNCREMTAMLRWTPNPFVEELAKRVNTVAAAPWGVQLSAGFSRDRVLGSYALIERKYRSILAEHDPSIFRLKNRSRGTRDFFQVRVGASTREAANRLCASLRSAGGACLVLRNPVAPAQRPSCSSESPAPPEDGIARESTPAAEPRIGAR